MHILLTGGTGLIGRGLCRRWSAEGHRLTVWSRDPGSVAARCGEGVRGIGRLEDYGDDPLDAVVNLAGAGIADRPWSQTRRALLRASRLALSKSLVAWLAQRRSGPSLLLSGSAVGWYGDAGDAELDESSPPRDQGFASRLCADWERIALAAETAEMRVVVLRTGLVLAREGGFLARLLPPFRLGLGGRLGQGRQWMPWIHLADQIALIDFLLRHPQARGPYNACAPQPVRNRDFTRALARALGRPACLPLPAWLLKAGLGELSGLLLGGQRVVPLRALQAGFVFRFNTLESALADLLSEDAR
ncbi:TIGR01777 family oxidoreductase [Pseudomonas sp. RIT-PI-AD]|uniref:TIGR01777 family oxidoreductase n=1 Tax=Pseudomonas sp. RIT-PI-AD TaxID=3035294 RepID=UPI0021D87A4E|nr:TIGR01777 family oxidoreductase [Pseudomonas sp. RIT-PI-AD]